MRTTALTPSMSCVAGREDRRWRYRPVSGGARVTGRSWIPIDSPTCTSRPHAVYRNRRKHTRRGKMESNNGLSRTEVATLGGGCFWCLEAVYQELRGVEKVESGYSGGHVPDPTYREV